MSLSKPNKTYKVGQKFHWAGRACPSRQPCQPPEHPVQPSFFIWISRIAPCAGVIFFFAQKFSKAQKRQKKKKCESSKKLSFAFKH